MSKILNTVRYCKQCRRERLLGKSECPKKVNKDKIPNPQKLSFTL